MAAPTFVDEHETAWNSSTSPKTTAAWDVTANDLLVVVGGTEDDNSSLNTPTGGSLTYTLHQSVVATNFSTCYGWTATVDANKNMSVSITKSGTAGHFFGFNVARFSGSDGVGTSAKTNVDGGAPSLNITTTGDNSAIVVMVLDWNAVDGASRTWRTVNGITPSAGNGLELSYFRNTTNYAIYAAYYSDAGTAGIKTVGLSAPGGQKYSIVAVEVLGSAGGATVNGSGVGSFTFTGAGSGVPTVLGGGAGSFAFTAPAAGIPTVLAVASGGYTFDGSAAGVPTVVGQASAALDFAGAAQGVPEVLGQAAAAVVFGSAASGVPTVSGAAAAGLDFTAAATGEAAGQQAGTGAGSYAFAASAAGVPTVLGVAAAAFGFSGAASGSATPPVSGAGAGAYAFAASALGVRVRPGIATQTVVFAAAAAGLRTVSGLGEVQLVFTGAAASPPPVTRGTLHDRARTGPEAADRDRAGPEIDHTPRTGSTMGGG